MPWREKPIPTWPNTRMDGRIPKPITTQKYSVRPIDPSPSRLTTCTAYTAKSLYLNVSLRPNDALRVANAALAINPNAAYLYATRSSAETYSRQFEQAKADVEQARRLSPRDPRIGQ